MVTRRLLGAGATLLGVAALLSTGTATAAPKLGASASSANAITIFVSENPLVAGDQLSVFGRLRATIHVAQQVTLWHQLPGQSPASVATTTTDVNGFYAFAPADSPLTTNRALWVTSGGAQSRTVNERVQAQVTLTGPPSGSQLFTGRRHAVTFTGSTSPFLTGDRVWLQRQNATNGGDDWGTIGHGTVQADGSFTITHAFVVPGDANIRALVARTVNNAPSPSNELTYQISQAENPALTLTANPDILAYGQSATLAGVVLGGNKVPVTLMARTDGTRFSPVAQSTTDAGGHFTFTQMPINNTLYFATTGGRRVGGRSSAQVFVGVHDVLSTPTVSATTIMAGQSITVTGSVQPDKSGHVIYLQRQNHTGDDFHNIASTRVQAGSTYTLQKSFFVPGTYTLRVHISGGPETEGASSAPFQVTVTPVPPGALPQIQVSSSVSVS